jgi:hypothetical protein
MAISNWVNFYYLSFSPHAGWHHYCNAAIFSSFEKICYAFFQIRLRRTEQKKAAYAVAGRFLRRLMRRILGNICLNKIARSHPLILIWFMTFLKLKIAKVSIISMLLSFLNNLLIVLQFLPIYYVP